MNLEKTYRDYRENPRKRRSWAADNPGNMAIRAELVSAVLELAGEQLSRNGKILDIGCGGGWMLDQLAQRRIEPNRLHGVDLIEARVETARRRLPQADIRRADARSLPYPNGEFELLLMFTCLSSMPDRESLDQAVAEVKRVLATGGLLLSYEPRIPNPFNSATIHVSPRLFENALGPKTRSLKLTGLPPVARHIGRLTPQLYPLLTRIAPTHRLYAFLKSR